MYFKNIASDFPVSTHSQEKVYSQWLFRMFGSKPKKQKKNIYDNLSQGVLMQLQNLKNAQGKQTSKHRAKANELSRAVSKVSKLIQYFKIPNDPKVLLFVYIETVIGENISFHKFICFKIYNAFKQKL